MDDKDIRQKYDPCTLGAETGPQTIIVRQVIAEKEKQKVLDIHVVVPAKKPAIEQIVDVFDHATVFNKNTPHIELAHELKSRGHDVILVDYQPTSENMVIDFSNKIKNLLPENIKLHSLRLQETETSFAEWFASDN